MRRHCSSRTLIRMADILVLALAAAVYPTLLAIVLVVLSRPQPARLLAAYLAGGYIAGIGIGCLIVFGLKDAGATSANVRRVSPWVDIVVGLLAIALALTLATGHDPRPDRLRRRAANPGGRKKEPWTKRAVSHDSIRMAFVLGIVLDLPSLWYLIALKDIATSGDSALAQFAQIVIFNVIMFVLVEVPLVAYLIDPVRAQAMVGRFNRWLRRNARRITESVAGGMGTYLVVRGVVAL
jgi:hypothetical protein